MLTTGPYIIVIQMAFLQPCSAYESISEIKIVGFAMRVDLSPRLGGHTCVPPTVERDRRPVEWPINLPPLLSTSHSASFSPPPPERCKVSQQVWNRVMN